MWHPRIGIRAEQRLTFGTCGIRDLASELYKQHVLIIPTTTWWIIDTSCKHLTKASPNVFYGRQSIKSMRSRRCNLAFWPLDFPLATVEKADTNEAK